MLLVCNITINAKHGKTFSILKLLTRQIRLLNYSEKYFALQISALIG